MPIFNSLLSFFLNRNLTSNLGWTKMLHYWSKVEETILKFRFGLFIIKIKLFMILINYLKPRNF